MITTLECLELLRENKTSHYVICFLYNSCFRIAIHTIARKYSTGNHIFLNNELTFENIATDAIAPLFTKIKPDEPIGLQKSLELWENPVVNPAQAEFFIHKIVWNRVAQHVTSLLKQADPIFKKIHASIKHYAITNGYNRITFFGIVYITEPENKTITSCVIPNEEIESLHGDYFKGKFDSIFDNIFQFIKRETGYFPAIPMNAFVRKLKLISGNDFFESTSELFFPHFEENLDINRIIQASLNQVYYNMERTYARSFKIEENVLTIYKLVLQEVSEDLKNGGINRGLFDYLKFHLNNLTKEEFYEVHHSQLNYLINLLKKAIAEKIKTT